MLRHKVLHLLVRAMAMALAGLLSVYVVSAQDPAALHQVNRLYIVVEGSRNQTQRFHDLLEGDLRHVGFDVLGKTAGADATLHVEFLTESHAANSFARATFTIKNAAGRLIWSGDLFSTHHGDGPDTTVEDLAQNCAERLRKDWEKGAK